MFIFSISYSFLQIICFIEKEVAEVFFLNTIQQGKAANLLFVVNVDAMPESFLRHGVDRIWYLLKYVALLS